MVVLVRLYDVFSISLLNGFLRHYLLIPTYSP
nr:MAG TPA: Protein of unknown function (DUF1435) [Caudoviricetes sp.]